ncbi:hypothetical protein DF141_21600 [Burkholderia cenocepacia]|nr:hypothetical protein DF141_21600 [Burkholderia cenocepacia]RQV08044.1 hypothetical protein DF039_29895 [Burkholderia cenocepacia]RQV29458.1 hypothetical protein DF132_06405 [Burkholderia cenocepacia]RQV65009.1 hypothetical protein DF018_24635 [Burkholderia cenocepacia]RQZ91748.1 hypothetical protein DF058_22295 [Burkholderia cenocepacia]
MPGAAPLRHPVKPAPVMVDRGFSGARRKTPADGPDKPNDRLIRPSIHRETIVRQPASAP